MIRAWMVCVVLFGAPAVAQVSHPLTNCDVFYMYDQRNTQPLLEAIRTSPTRLDVSVEGLASLRSLGISQEVLAVMVEEAATSDPAGDLKGLPCRQGFYYRSTDGWLQVHESGVPIFKNSIFDSLRRRQKRVWSGSRSSTRIPDPEPVLYGVWPRAGSVAHTSPLCKGKDLILVKLRSHKKRRSAACINWNPIDFWPAPPHCSFGSSATQLKVQPVSMSTISLRPETPLQEGEYATVTCSASLYGVMSHVDFGVDSSTTVETHVDYEGEVSKPDKP